MAMNTLSEEEERLVEQNASQRADEAMENFQVEMRSLVGKIKAQGSTRAAVDANVPSCKGGLSHCLGTYTTALNKTLAKDGTSLKGLKLLQYEGTKNTTYASSKWGSPQLACPGAVTYFITNKDEELKKCAISLKDRPGQKLGDILKSGEIEPGSLILVRSKGNTTTGLHAVMFEGLDEKTGEPLYTCANREMIRGKNSDWSNQIAAKDRSKDSDVCIIKMRDVLELKMKYQEEQELLKDRQAYMAKNAPRQTIEEQMKNYLASSIEPIKTTEPRLPKLDPSALQISVEALKENRDLAKASKRLKETRKKESREAMPALAANTKKDKKKELQPSLMDQLAQQQTQEPKASEAIKSIPLAALVKANNNRSIS